MEVQVKLSKGEAEVLDAILANHGRLSQRDASCNLDISSAQLAHFISRLKLKGYRFEHRRMRNPVTGKRYTVYLLEE